MAYEIQEWCLCGGWTNTWSWEDDNGISVPTTYETKEEAEIALIDFFEDCRFAFLESYMPDEPEEENFRIVQIEE